MDTIEELNEVYDNETLEGCREILGQATANILRKRFTPKQCSDSDLQEIIRDITNHHHTIVNEKLAHELRAHSRRYRELLVLFSRQHVRYQELQEDILRHLKKTKEYLIFRDTVPRQIHHITNQIDTLRRRFDCLSHDFMIVQENLEKPTVRLDSSPVTQDLPPSPSTDETVRLHVTAEEEEDAQFWGDEVSPPSPEQVIRHELSTASIVTVEPTPAKPNVRNVSPPRPSESPPPLVDDSTDSDLALPRPDPQFAWSGRDNWDPLEHVAPAQSADDPDLQWEQQAAAAEQESIYTQGQSEESLSNGSLHNTEESVQHASSSFLYLNLPYGRKTRSEAYRRRKREKFHRKLTMKYGPQEDTH